nr:enolase C-terminal domain-like protein [Pseudenhygromyxa sp. WMMC2535]
MSLCDFKIKVGRDLERDRELIAHVRQRLPGARIRLDANNAFGHDIEGALLHLSKLDGYWAVEEPLLRGRPEAVALIARALDVPVILDEAILTLEDFERFAALDAEWILNLKVSRVGGVLRALGLVRAAREAGWGIIVGAQAGESSLLTRAGHLVARAAGGSLRAMEGAVGTHMLHWEPNAPSLRFGRGGCLDLDDFELEQAGWGLREDGAPPEPVAQGSSIFSPTSLRASSLEGSMP